jgi:enamine deaminase RidA (YjgF/YER057c/UK114 family)
MTDIQRLNSGPRMSQAVIHEDVVYLAGQVAADARSGSVAEQTLSVLAKIDSLLAAAGSDKSKLLSARIWLQDLRRFDEMNAAWIEWVPPGTAPTRVVTEASLAAPGYLVEITVVAAR